jgi:hypothetical protein
MVQTTTTNLYNNLVGDGTGAMTFGSFGTVTVNGTSPQTIVDAAYTLGDIVLFGLLTAGGTVSPAGPAVLTGTTGTGFTVGATASDTSVYNWVRFTPAAKQTS